VAQTGNSASLGLAGSQNSSLANGNGSSHAQNALATFQFFVQP
jgi:hypothetical protein